MGSDQEDKSKNQGCSSGSGAASALGAAGRSSTAAGSWKSKGKEKSKQVVTLRFRSVPSRAIRPVCVTKDKVGADTYDIYIRRHIHKGMLQRNACVRTVVGLFFLVCLFVLFCFVFPYW